ncbi:MAG: hypothetical protein KA717_22300 [Woronichinia naegeliana WA131]|jgi:hypothetical protein|uniref:Uncharacterized protein n=1 Tax=Woronichinia naegeliana WA131 TaxID=2824559 RepID=A0A977KS86_9CYAN|nr:MAG: hypothetical protein KA717_22300 [Woronichinia naegeliana WA131]
MSTDPILAAIADLVSLEGGLAELEEEQTLNILLTKNIAKALELPEEVSLSTQIDNPNSLFVTYHSDLLQKFSNLLGTRGLVASLGVQFTGHFKNSGFDKMVLQKIIPHNGLIKFVEAKRQNTPYLWCHVAYTAEADEKRIGMISFFVNGLTGVAPVEIGDALLWQSDRIAIDPQYQPQIISIEELTPIIEKISGNMITENLHHWSAKLARAKARDEERLRAYYGTISSEINRKIMTKQLVDEAKEKEELRLAATEGELERKLADLEQRYAMQIEANLYSAMVIYLPTVHVQCELTRKKAKRMITAIWNPFTKIIEPLRCELSGETIYDFYLDEKEAKMIAPSYWENSGMGKRK